MTARQFAIATGCYALVAACWLLLVGLLFAPNSLTPPDWATRWLCGAEAVGIVGVLYLLRERRL